MAGAAPPEAATWSITFAVRSSDAPSGSRRDLSGCKGDPDAALRILHNALVRYTVKIGENSLDANRHAQPDLSRREQPHLGRAGKDRVAEVRRTSATSERSQG